MDTRGPAQSLSIGEGLDAGGAGEAVAGECEYDQSVGAGQGAGAGPVRGAAQGARVAAVTLLEEFIRRWGLWPQFECFKAERQRERREARREGRTFKVDEAALIHPVLPVLPEPHPGLCPCGACVFERGA